MEANAQDLVKPSPPPHDQPSGQPVGQVYNPLQKQPQYPPTPAVTQAPIPGPPIPGPAVMAQGNPGPHPFRATCASCSTEVTTEITPVAGLKTWLSAVLICCVGGDCGCCLIPFCVDSCRDVQHRCPSCKTYIGIHKRM
ncbi:Lipopolysaccharide-induced tumor necrosis factor-alpha factor -like protein [Halotydeus destructor]|nr:Lipopolysaccharide-induced tumor necrosis factor-alpha factor -like protein [Halotydeus destructor]